MSETPDVIDAMLAAQEKLTKTLVDGGWQRGEAPPRTFETVHDYETFWAPGLGRWYRKRTVFAPK